MVPVGEMMVILVPAALALPERAHEVDELIERQSSSVTEIVEDDLDQARGDRILVELGHAPEVVGIEVAFVALGIAAVVAVELVEARPQRGDLLLR